MAKYRKKPVEIETWQWNGDSIEHTRTFCKINSLPNFNVGERNGMTGLVIPTLEGDHIAIKGDFIIKGVKDEYYPCKPDIFYKTYDIV